MTVQERNKLIQRTIDDVRIYFAAAAIDNPLLMIDKFRQLYPSYREYWYNEKDEVESGDKGD